MVHFTHLEISEWQQFRSINIDFDRPLTILTGANASGKTTLLNLLARHAGWQVPSLAVPRQSVVGGIIKFFMRFFSGEDRPDNKLGRITYSNEQQATLTLAERSDTASYQVSITDQQSVPCFLIPSHRSVYRYQKVTEIPASRIDPQQAFARVFSSTQTRYFGGGEQPNSFHMKQTLISWSIFGRGNADMPPDVQLFSYYEGFQGVLARLLPTTLGFKRFSIRNLEVVLECESGDFMIDGASGGLGTLIDLAWQIFMFRHQHPTGFTVLIDEVENHLHPTMQRRVLADLLNAFPEVRFIVSTHSPLIVGSVRDSSVYVLRYDTQKTVRSERLDLVNHARTATEILNDVLGVSSTMPLWAEAEIDAIVTRMASGPITEESFVSLRRALEDLGLTEFIPITLGKILEARPE